MQGTMRYGPRDVRLEECPDPKIIEPTDAILRISAACLCGSNMWPYRGIEKINGRRPMGQVTDLIPFDKLETLFKDNLK